VFGGEVTITFRQRIVNILSTFRWKKRRSNGIALFDGRGFDHDKRYAGVIYFWPTADKAHPGADVAGKRATPGNESENKLSELELTLTVLWNCVRRWMSQRNNSSVVTGLSDLDVFLLHMLVYRNKQLRGMDLAFALSIDDMHLVSYSLKKLTRLGVISSARRGKEVFYSANEKGREHYFEFLSDRRKYLEPAMKLIPQDVDLESLNKALRTLSSVYEQAARSAASARGI
jgi:predicted MarR family transcription regulator